MRNRETRFRYDRGMPIAYIDANGQTTLRYKGPARIPRITNNTRGWYALL